MPLWGEKVVEDVVVVVVVAEVGVENTFFSFVELNLIQINFHAKMIFSSKNNTYLLLPFATVATADVDSLKLQLHD
jgi:hypothetical protein